MQEQQDAISPPTNSVWNRGPPASEQQQQHHQHGFSPRSRPPAGGGPRVGRVHHNLDPQDAQIHAYQLSAAQQLCMAALQQGRELGAFQLDVARASGLDERALRFQIEPFSAHLLGTEPPLGLTLIRDPEAYTHIELLQRYPHLASVNFVPVDMKLARGNMFLAICAKEAQVHEALKYGYWMLPQSALQEVAKLNDLFAEMVGIAPIYLFVACLDSCYFSGVCEMVAPATAAEPGLNGKYTGMHRVPIRFVMCKNVPFSNLPFINLFQQQQSGVLLQPMRNVDAARALTHYARYPTGTSVLMDFKHFDDAEARGVEGESGEAALRAAHKAKARRSFPNNPSPQHNNNHQQQQARGGRQPPPHQQQQQQLITANDERVVLPSKIVYEVKQKKSNKERKHQAKLRQEEQRRAEEQEAAEYAAAYAQQEEQAGHEE